MKITSRLTEVNHNIGEVERAQEREGEDPPFRPRPQFVC